MSDVITSLQNNRVKLAKQLQSRTRTRRKERKIVLEGNRLIADALDYGEVPVYVLYDLETADYDLVARLQQTPAELLPVSGSVLQHVSDTQQSQGMIAVFPLPVPDLPDSPERVLILDALSEPGNMGTILRTAAAAGVSPVILSPGCVDPYNPKVLRAGMGAHFRIPIVEARWHEIKSYCETLALYAADGNSDTIYTAVDWTQPHALIIGNEAHGLSQQAADLPVTSIAIPMASQTESLNAAVATGILLFEAQRQRQHQTT